MTLAEIPLGKSGRILDVTGEDGVAIRLMEMGLVDGEIITFIGAAPLGDPLEYSVCGYRLSLRRSEANRVQVEPATIE